MGIYEITDYLGVSRKRVDEIRRTESLRFPEPLVVLRCGPVWSRYKVEQWANKWERKVGRPRKLAS
jgi:hypothetical protein